jgi:hypothetical protein
MKQSNLLPLVLIAAVVIVIIAYFMMNKKPSSGNTGTGGNALTKLFQGKAGSGAAVNPNPSTGKVITPAQGSYQATQQSSADLTVPIINAVGGFLQGFDWSLLSGGSDNSSEDMGSYPDDSTYIDYSSSDYTQF